MRSIKAASAAFFSFYDQQGPRLTFAGCCALAIGWLVPNHYPPWNSLYSESCAALGLTLLFAGGLSRLPAGRLPTSVVVIAALAGVPWVQWSFGLFPYVGDAWLSSLYLLGFALAIGVGYVNGREPGLAVPLAWTCLLGGLVSTAFALAQFAQVQGLGIWVMDSYGGMRPYANLGQPNNLATLIGISFASLFLLHVRGLIGKASGAGIAVFLSLGMAVTQSRTALLYGPTAIALLWFWKRRLVATRQPLGAFAAIVAFQWVAMYLWPTLQSALLMASSTPLAQRDARSIRSQVWPVLLDAMSTRPWFGFGWQQVGAAELSAADRHPPATELYLQAHNILLDLAISCGYPLALVVAGLIAYWLVTRIRWARTPEGVAGLLAIGMFFIHAMLELPHHYAYFLIPIGLWIGIVETQIDARARAPARWLWPLAALGAAGTATIWIDYAAFEEEFRLVRFQGANIITPASALKVPTNPAFSALSAFLEQARRAPSKEMSEHDLQVLRQNVERYPYAASLERYAEALALRGRLEEARQTFVKIRYIYGDQTYARVRVDLHEQVERGQLGLAALDSSLPAAESLRP